MTKSELIEILSRKQPQLSYKDIELAVKTILEYMSSSLSKKLIEIHALHQVYSLETSFGN